ncbi:MULTISPECIES: relaxase/mobilization nuclease domain-containing protein [Brucella/Ochrobactrum group]|jgi:type IV secretion system T-DNA border endonuclease VirD2|uniref:relaxase/mobilization nuclease domain-containing protein n=1 Tax=Brucella/Ochrobactrum group TaxID=2826938 RepID=UPI001C054CE6|nr:relaxase/mobilization nuclease domain-containing protein [Brucella sp. NBRC 12950]QWK80643.1 relaxase/mobilization nuclease domain-containing protein [Ochrobactrum sp. BTU1]GLU27964.1 hypothetical protein Brsp01_31970 [Brucella sp. NBRC 12950]
MAGANQAIVHIVHNGGARSEERLNGQFKYLTRDGTIPGERSTRYGTTITLDELENCANSWIRQNGAYPKTTSRRESKTDLTTHIVVSLPVNTDRDIAKQIGREWASELFASGECGGVYDYVAFFHDDRPHPHTHVVVHRKPLSGEKLRISHRNPDINYDSMREKLAEIAMRHGVLLDASSRESRDLPPSTLSAARYRVLLRQGVIVREHGEDEGSNANYYVDDPDLASSLAVSSSDGASLYGGSTAGDSPRSPATDIYGSDLDEYSQAPLTYEGSDAEAMDIASDEETDQIETDHVMDVEPSSESPGSTELVQHMDTHERGSGQLDDEHSRELANFSEARRRDRRDEQIDQELLAGPSRRRVPGRSVHEISERSEPQQDPPLADKEVSPIQQPRQTKGERIRRKSALMARLRDTPARRERRRRLKLELIERRRAEHAKNEAERIARIEERYGKLRQTKERQQRAALDRERDPTAKQRSTENRENPRGRTS